MSGEHHSEEHVSAANTFCGAMLQRKKFKVFLQRMCYDKAGLINGYIGYTLLNLLCLVENRRVQMMC